MLHVEGNTIKLTRGDTAYLNVPIVAYTQDGTTIQYEVKPDDELTFTIKKTTKDEEPILQKKLIGSNTFHILPEDTNDWAYSKFVYDVQLKNADGDIYTIIEPSSFQITQEVTF